MKSASCMEDDQDCDAEKFNSPSEEANFLEKSLCEEDEAQTENEIQSENETQVEIEAERYVEEEFRSDGEEYEVYVEVEALTDVENDDGEEI